MVINDIEIIIQKDECIDGFLLEMMNDLKKQIIDVKNRYLDK